MTERFSLALIVEALQGKTCQDSLLSAEGRRRVYAAGVHADGVCCTDKEQCASFTAVVNWAIELNAAIQSPVTEFTSFSSRKFATRCCITAYTFAIYGLIA